MKLVLISNSVLLVYCVIAKKLMNFAESLSRDRVIKLV